MKVTFKDNEVRFDTLRVGQTFIDMDYDEDAVLMVVEASLDVDLGPSKLVEEEIVGYAVELSGGGVYGFRADEMVVPVESEVIVKRS